MSRLQMGVLTPLEVIFRAQRVLFYDPVLCTEVVTPSVSKLPTYSPTSCDPKVGTYVPIYLHVWVLERLNASTIYET